MKNRVIIIIGGVLLFLSQVPFANAITVSGQVVFAADVPNVSNVGVEVLIDISGSTPIKVETAISIDDPGSGQFSFDIGDVSDEAFILSARVISGRQDSFSDREVFYSEQGPTLAYRLAKFFDRVTRDISDLRLEIGATDTISGTLTIPPFDDTLPSNQRPSFFMSLDRVFNVPVPDPPVGRDPRPNRGYLPPQRTVFFFPDETSQPYGIKFMRDPRLSYSLSVSCSKCRPMPLSLVALAGGQLVPTSSLSENPPNTLVFNSAAGPRTLDLYPFALNGPISIRGRVVIPLEDISSVDRPISVEVFSVAAPNEVIESKELVLLKNSSDANFQFSGILGDPTGANLMLRILDIKNRPCIDKRISLSPRHNHENVVINFNPCRSQHAHLGAVMLLLDE